MDKVIENESEMQIPDFSIYPDYPKMDIHNLTLPKFGDKVQMKGMWENG